MPATGPLDVMYDDRRPSAEAPGAATSGQRVAVACLAAVWLAYLAVAAPVVWRALLSLPGLAAGTPTSTAATPVAAAAAGLATAFAWFDHVLATWLGVGAAGLSLLVVRRAALRPVRRLFVIAAATAVASACLIWLPTTAFIPKVLQLVALSLPFVYGASGTWRAWRRLHRAPGMQADA